VSLPDPWLPRPCRITDVRRELDDTVTLVLDPGPDGLPFAPGQFTMLWRHGHGEVAISISGDPAEPQRLVHTIRGVGSVTRPLQDAQVGDVLGVRGPFGAGWPVDAARGGDLVIVAGGIGLAPLRPAVLAALADRPAFGRIVVLVGARQPDMVLYPHDLIAWDQDPTVEVAVTVDRPDADWWGPVGVVTRLLAGLDLDGPNTTVLTCGPEIMMRFVAQEAAKQGVPADRIFVSMERNMQCAIGLCGHCQWGPDFVCADGPVFSWARASRRLAVREV
jgi:NAD(P)H-flavin reductase